MLECLSKTRQNLLILVFGFLCGCANGYSELNAPMADGSGQDPNDGANAIGDGNSEPLTGWARFTFVGRFDNTYDPNYMLFGMEASRIGVGFTGTSLAMRLADSGNDYFEVSVDGNRLSPPIKIQQSTAPVIYTVASNLSDANHVAWITKRTESNQDGNPNYGIVKLYEIIIDSNATFLTPPTTRARRVEFMGDSGFSGYGSELNISNCGYSIDTQNALKSIPQATADFLNADIVNLSATGKGVYFSYHDGPDAYSPNSDHTFGVLYEEVVFPRAQPRYNFASNKIDAVVLSVGGNDLWGSDGNGYFPKPTFDANKNIPGTAWDRSASDPNYFIGPMTKLLVQINKHNPGILIVCVVSQSAKDNDKISLSSAFAASIAAAKLQGVSNAVSFSYYDDPKYNDNPNIKTYTDLVSNTNVLCSCGCHPSASGAQWLGYRLARFISDQKQWEAPPTVPYPTP